MGPGNAEMVSARRNEPIGREQLMKTSSELQSKKNSPTNTRGSWRNPVELSFESDLNELACRTIFQMDG